MTDRVLLIDIGEGAGPLPEVTPVPAVYADWMPKIHAAAALPPPAVTAMPAADAVVLEWQPLPKGSAMKIQVAPDVSGAPGAWVTVATIANATRYTLTLPAGMVHYRAFVVRYGVESEPSSPAQAVPIVPAPLAALVDAQVEIDRVEAESVQRDLQGAQDAAADAQQRVAAARNVLQQQIDTLNAELADIHNAPVHTAAEAYATGQLVRHGGALYQAKQSVPAGVAITDTAYWLKVGDYASMGDAVAAALSLAQQTADTLAAESQRLDLLIARVPAGSGALATEALVAATQSALAAADQALSQRIGLVEARMPGGDGALATAASVTSVEQASVTRDAALADRATAVEASAASAHARVTSAEQAIADEASARAQAIQSVNASLAGKASASVVQSMQAYASSGNLLVNAALSTLDGVAVLWSQDGDPGWTLTDNPGSPFSGFRYVPPGVRCFRIYKPAVFARGSIQAISIGAPVDARTASTVIASVEVNTFGCEAAVWYEWLDGSGQVVSSGYGDRHPQIALDNPLALPRIFVKTTRPPTGVFINMAVSAFGTGGAHPFLWASKPMVESVPAERDTPSQWAVGGGEANARYTLAVTGGSGGRKRTGGMVAASDGAVVGIDFVGDSIRFVPPEGVPSGAEIKPGDGGLIRQFGPGWQRITSATPFGPDNLVMYFGPNVGVAAASKAFATKWEDASGNSYTGGTYSAGMLLSAERYNVAPVQAAGSARTLTHHNSNGRMKTVIGGYSSHYQATAQFGSQWEAQAWLNGFGSPSGAVTYRVRRGAAEILTGTAHGAAHKSGPDELDVGVWEARYTYEVNGSTTSTDTFGGTGSVDYVIEITGTSGSVQPNYGVLALQVQEAP